MKTTFFNLALATLAAGALFFTSCKKDNGDEEVPKPSLTLKSSGGYTFSDQTVSKGSSVMFGVIASAGEKLNGFKMTVSYDGASPTTLVDRSLNDASFAWDTTVSSRTVAGTEKYTFTVTDKNGESAFSSVTVTTVSYGTISTYSTLLMGGQSNSSTGSFFSASNGQVYLQANAMASSNLIDLLYYYGATNYATLAAPDDASAATIYNGTSGLQNWTTKNATRFVTTTLSTTDFDNAANDSAIVANVSSPTDTKLTALATGNVIGFQTAGGKKGLIKIGAINTGAAGDITVTVKVQ